MFFPFFQSLDNFTQQHFILLSLRIWIAVTVKRIFPNMRGFLDVAIMFCAQFVVSAGIWGVLKNLCSCTVLVWHGNSTPAFITIKLESRAPLARDAYKGEGGGGLAGLKYVIVI